MILNRQFFSKEEFFSSHHESDTAWTDKPIPSVGEITWWILQSQKQFSLWVSQAVVPSLAAGSVRAERAAVQESSQPWLLPVEDPAISVSLLPWGSFVWQRGRKVSTANAEKLLRTYVCTFVCWHLRKIAQELLGHIVHILEQHCSCSFCCSINISDHLKGKYCRSSLREAFLLTTALCNVNISA